MTGKIILIEGSEATGKSTVAKELAKYYGGIHYHNPAGISESSNKLYDYIKDNANALCDDAMLLLMLSSHITNITEMNALKASGEVVVCDRSILSSFAYNSDYSAYKFRKLLKYARVPELDYDNVFILYSTKKTILERLYSRNDNDPLDDVFINKIDNIIKRYNDDVSSFYPDYIRIDTDNLKSDHVTQMIKEKIL